MAKVKCPKCDYTNSTDEPVCTRCRTILPRVSMDDTPNEQRDLRQIMFRRAQIIANRYTVIEMIGKGGMGCIYRVHDNTLNEEVALKTLLPQFVRDKLVVERFYNEARIARQLSHPGIVRVHDIGFAGNILYISMEYLKGRSLRAELDRLPVGQRLPIRTTLRVIDELCKALEYAHQFTIHRDIKPENIMVGKDGSIKLMDFGISKLMTHTSMTAASMVMGTPYYMSPEQLKDSSNVDARADIYSVGVVLYEMLTSSLPTGVIKPASQMLREVPPALDPIVAKCVEPDPNNRYASAAELREAIRPIRELIEAGTDPGTIGTGRSTSRRGTPRRIVGALVVAAILAATAFGVWKLDQKRREALSSTPSGAVSGTSNAQGVPQATGDEFDRLAKFVAAATTVAEAAAEKDDRARELLALGKASWERAQQARQSGAADAVDQAWKAAHILVGAAARPIGMTFIPGGAVRVRGESGAVTYEVDGFFIDQTEVTNRQFFEFATAHRWRSPAYDEMKQSPLYPMLLPPDIPVTMVTFYDAEAFAASQGKKLPTEAQWARAAFATTGAESPYPWPPNPETAPSSALGDDDGFAAAAPIRSFPADCTHFGCFDMTGNVSEWTRTLFSATPEASPREVENQEDLAFNLPIVVRGGSWSQDRLQTSLETRYAMQYQVRQPFIGFRCVVEMPRSIAALQKMLHRTDL